ncbi:TetR/AcrR family transcriptional regulator [Kribbella pittospori]|uniref:TetR/AcrR family transcriptional regulator n=1 Tax=Kribbella pittospori TaxID=722689 RepID=A0A4R0KYN4_9ACTN|nr:TetR/AcrR family transcriptional regulator [Kribbella pittospori]TCC65800.1 TetR/AcrR family transcriptional regulator [Kribbella pittospori]
MAGVRQFDEEMALRRALEVFWEHGFHQTSMPDLASGTGVQRGSLYHAYGGKEQIFLKAFERFATTFLDGAAAALAGTDPRTSLFRFFDYCIESITTGSPSRGCLSTRTAVEADTPALQRAVRQLLDDLENLVLESISGADLTLRPREAARLIVATTRALAVLERVYDDPRRLRETARSQVRTLLR